MLTGGFVTPLASVDVKNQHRHLETQNGPRVRTIHTVICVNSYVIVGESLSFSVLS